QKIKAKAGIEADLNELQSLNVDLVTEIARAMSGGTPRMTIFNVLRGEASVNFGMTADVAHRTVQTGRNTVKNRMAGPTEDINAMEKMSRGLVNYGPSPKEKAANTMQIRNKTTGVEAEGPAGPVPAGWEKIGG